MKTRIQQLIERYVDDFDDYEQYDKLDVKISKVVKQIPKDVDMLKKSGYKVVKTHDPGYTVDGDIDLGDGYNVQVMVNGGYLLTHHEGGFFSSKTKQLGDGNTIKDIIKILDKLKVVPKTN